MTWVRYDDNVANHPKVAPLDDATYRLWRESIEWCAHNLTDGQILTTQLMLTSVRASKPRAAKLVVAGLWHLADMACTSAKCPPGGKNGWVIHDYWQYQPTREKARAEQLAKAERQARWLARKAGDGKRDEEKDASQDTSKDGAPAPPRPAPKGGEGLRPPIGPPPLADGRTADRCDQCGNGRESAYHRNVCAAVAA